MHSETEVKDYEPERYDVTEKFVSVYQHKFKFTHQNVAAFNYTPQCLKVKKLHSMKFD